VTLGNDRDGGRSPRPSAARALLEWFDGRQREVPWRAERDPWRILVAEVMAQQTRIETVAPYYRSFLRRFPTPATLAVAPLDDVLKRWEGLGYYARARHLHAAAGQIVAEHGGDVPATVEGLRSLAGIGPYTAGAVASLAFDVPEPAIDGNARRVLSRLYDLPAPAPSELDRRARALLAAVPDRAAALNQAIMDLGGSLCTSRSPRCPECPLVRACLARARGTVAERPLRARKGAPPLRFGASAIVRRDERALLVRRPDRGLLGGLWDLPGTAPSDEPVAAEALSRKLSRDLGLDVTIGEHVDRVPHAFSHFRFRLDVFEAVWGGGEPEGLAWRWAAAADLDALAFPTYLRPVLPRIRGTS